MQNYTESKKALDKIAAKYIAMDNSEGDAWMEEFDSYGECVLWLLAVVNAQGEPTDDNDKPINEYFK